MKNKIEYIYIIVFMSLIAYTLLYFALRTSEKLNFSDYFNGLGAIGTAGAFIFIIIQMKNDHNKNIDQIKPVIFPMSEAFFQDYNTGFPNNRKKFIAHEKYITSTSISIYLAKNIAKNITIKMECLTNSENNRDINIPYLIENQSIDLDCIAPIIDFFNTKHNGISLFLRNPDYIADLENKINQEIKYKLIVEYYDFNDLKYRDMYAVKFKLENKFGTNIEHPYGHHTVNDCIVLNYEKL
ncbi:hypothetical protein [Elizabethkingia anophelis]|uniref:Uncharacterized protein n=1 Tax=Elizabethkingia anophelis TaxID=1117645 RepID=A0A7Z7Q1Y6_9FLAO|nr:hypothetical protein [Elizabethkingia anophelis]MCT3845059.1 hypothetical protein [Elizabethkingia anophelis]STF08898.1 Uncharacterised protein [Elizabethkingia anophelis]